LIYKKAMAEALSSMDQDVDTSDILNAAKIIASKHLLRHRDKDIRLLVACCVCDVLRVFAPEPPYEEDTMKVINTP